LEENKYYKISALQNKYFRESSDSYGHAIRITIVSAEHIQPLLAIISCKPLPCHVLQPHEKHSLQIADETRLEVLFPFATDWMKRGTTL